ncbi:hypothetical protein BDY21DRAFT_367699 [Lineolata rhizophorae]|uniref:BPL/LPL catalytic domain-containing protein n=1 Tax=Lineolata rhizophorae TaxID=578093 RepID=A0A6A6NLF1_9PEZI|nr:hypothetical protein BDY21DRAFT_367699 [Lineolata rhizophorae]
MRLSHLHLPGLTPYATANRIQDVFRSRLLAQKAAASRARRSSAAPAAHPDASASPSPSSPSLSSPSLSSPSPSSSSSPPVLLTFTPPPTYTLGRRQHAAPPQLLAQLRAPGPDGGPAASVAAAAPRGGQTTFHGPGQLVGYVVADLRAVGVGVGGWVARLEAALVRTCAVWGVRGHGGGAGVDAARTGVWVRRAGHCGREAEGVGAEEGREEKQGKKEKKAEEAGAEEGSRIWRHGQHVERARGEADALERDDGWRKIAAIGIHLRRHVASHGVALNVSTDLRWFERIVACGMDGRLTTSLRNEGVADVTVDEAAGAFAAQLAARLGLEAEPYTLPRREVEKLGVELHGLEGW